MPKHSWINRTVPPFVVVAIVGCVWYALQSRPANPVAASSGTAQPSTQNTALANAAPVASPSPSVQRLGTQLQFTVETASYKNIQKVEFYVENQFVGSAYALPYSIAVNENTLTAGSHTVMAKIYTGGVPLQSQPASFIATPNGNPAPSPDTTDSTGAVPATISTPAATAVNPAAPASPTDLASLAASDGTAATLSWSQQGTAARYQVWRDGAQIATTTSTGYVDSGLNAGQTYDYQVIAMDAAGNASEPSDILAVTMPTPPLLPPANPTDPADANTTTNHEQTAPASPASANTQDSQAATT